MNNRYKFCLDLIKNAGNFLLEISEKKIELNFKNNDIQDLVTSADIEINNFISREIKKSFPGETIYSEEDSNIDVSGGSFWSIDPIDGTSSFSRNIPHFAVVLTYVKKGIPLVGAIYNPKTSELFSFEKGKGAFLNDKPVKVSPVDDLKNVYAFVRIGRDQENWDWGLASYKFLLANANKTYSLGSSSLDMCFVGAGRIEICVYGTLTTIDIAGALGFISEAGGFVVDSNGQEITNLTKEKQVVVGVNSKKLLSKLKNDIILPKLS